MGIAYFLTDVNRLTWNIRERDSYVHRNSQLRRRDIKQAAHQSAPTGEQEIQRRNTFPGIDAAATGGQTQQGCNHQQSKRFPL
jgi:hypothetical protein